MQTMTQSRGQLARWGRRTAAAVSAVILAASVATAQPPSIGTYANKFQRTYGRAASSDAASISHPLEVVPGGYAMVGTYQAPGSSSVMLVKTNGNGSLQWAKYYNETRQVVREGLDACSISGGDIAVLGLRQCPLITGGGGPTSCQSPHFDITVMRTNSTGAVLWSKRYGSSSGTEHGYAIERVGTSGFVIVGYSAFNASDAEGDFYVLRIDNSGAEVWCRTYSRPGFGFTANAVKVLNDGSFVLAGRVKGTNGDNDACLLKISSTGTPVWIRTLGVGNSFDAFYSIDFAGGTDLIACGERNGDAYVAKVDANGNLLWSKTYNGGSGEIGYDIRRDGTGYMVAGKVNGAKACLLAIDASGNVRYGKEYAPAGTTTSAMGLATIGDGYALGGRVSSGAGDFFHVKTDGFGDAGCNTASATFTATSRTDIASTAVTESLALSSPRSDGMVGYDVAGTATPYCYANVDWFTPQATIGDIIGIRGFVLGMTNTNGNNGGNVVDPTSEPATLEGRAWGTESVWVRTSQDAVLDERTAGHLYQNEFAHQSPDFSLGTNYVYVAVDNAGSLATAPGTLDVYWSVASTNMRWPDHWTGYVRDGVTQGGLVGSVTIPTIQPGETYVAEIAWPTPSPANFGGTTPSVSFLARYSSAEDPVTYAEVSSTETNATNNNNIVWRNDIAVGPGDMALGGTDVKTFKLRNTQAVRTTTAITIDIPTEEEAVSPVFAQANVYVDLGPTLYARWTTAGAHGTNITDAGGSRVQVTGDNATIEGITLEANEEFNVGMRFDHVGPDLDYQQFYHVDAMQTGGSGGVRYELEFPATAEAGKPATPATTLERAGFSLGARPNPTRSSTTIEFRLPEPTRASVALFDAAGHLVRTLAAEAELTAGTHTLEWDGTDAAGRPAPGGLYIYRLTTPGGALSRRLTLTR